VNTVLAINTLISVIVLGSIYSLVTVGYVVVFRASRVFNFLHPQLMFIGALMFTSVASGGVAGFLMGTVVSVVAMALLGGVVYLVAVHRTLGQDHWIQTILTMGLGVAFLNAAQFIWSPNYRIVKPPFKEVTWSIAGGGKVSSTDVLIVVSSATLSAALYWALSRSSWGLRFRATAEDPALCAYGGMRLKWWFCAAWAVAAAAAAIAGIGYSMRVPVDPGLSEVGLAAFPAAMIGGMDSISGAFAGAFVLAFIQQYGTAFWGPTVATPIAFACVLLLLVFRPNGLFGSQQVGRV
jgi:branched-chain amino acid transport system permease protein